MTPKQRDIVLVPVPCTDLTATKKRPVLGLSKSAHNRKAMDVVVAAMTSNLTPGAPGVVVTGTDLEAGLLPTNSLVRADKIYTLSKSIIIKRYGRLRETSFQKVLTALDDLFGRGKKP